MIEINLLPWRKQARQIKKVKLIILSIGFFIITLIAFIITHLSYSIQLRKQEKLNAYLQNEISVEQAALSGLDEKEKHELQLQVQMQFIMNLYAKNFRAVKLLNELTAIVPDNIFLNKIERDDFSIRLYGSAPSEADVTLFRKAIEQSSQFYKLSVNQISSEKSSTRVNFQLEMLQKE